MIQSYDLKQIQLIKNKEKIGNYLFLIALLIELIVMVTDNCASWTIPYRGRLVQIAFILFVMKICTTTYGVKQYAVIALLGLIGIISYLTCREELVIRAVVFVIAGKDVEVKQVIKVLLLGTIISSVIIAMLSLFGICGQVVDLRHYGRGIEEARYNLGFSHANNVQDTLWMILVYVIIIRGQKFKILDAVVWSVVNLSLYCLTLSRTGVIVCELVVIGCMFANYNSYKYYKTFILLSVLFTTGICVFLTLWSAKLSIHESRLEAFLDPFLTGRLEMVSERTDLRTWRLLPLEYNSAEVDNGFAYIGYSYGYLILLILILVIISLAYKLYKNDEAKAGILLLSVVLVIFMESTFIFNVSMICNVLLILWIVYGVNSGVDATQGE